MKTSCIFLFMMILLLSCSQNKDEKKLRETGNVAEPDSTGEGEGDASHGSAQKVYSNARFRNVTVEKVGVDTFLVKGKGQIFEANFGWVIEDGHHELKKGFEMTDAGAPAWGNFSFKVRVPGARPNSTLTLILFESSAKDGSRQYELPIPLGMNNAR